MKNALDLTPQPPRNVYKKSNSALALLTETHLNSRWQL